MNRASLGSSIMRFGQTSGDRLAAQDERTPRLLPRFPRYVELLSAVACTLVGMVSPAANVPCSRALFVAARSFFVARLARDRRPHVPRSARSRPTPRSVAIRVDGQ